jgi:DNA-directed RNA polymerase specialized sigma24 family protein
MPESPDFAELYALYVSAARRTARALVPEHAVEDIVAEAFTRVIAACKAGGGPTGLFRPYLLAAVRNLARDYNAERRHLALVPPDPRAVTVPGAGELAGWREERRMMARAFASLPKRWQAVLWQTEVEGVSPAALVPALAPTPNAVAQLAVRARFGLALAWQRERGTQERITGPVPALRLLAERNSRLTQVKDVG